MSGGWVVVLVGLLMLAFWCLVRGGYLREDSVVEEVVEEVLKEETGVDVDLTPGSKE